MPVDGRALLATWCEHRDADVRRRLIEHHLPLVRALAHRFRHSGEPLEDLVQVGAMGLIKAVDRYDRGFGSSFEAYLVPTVLGEIRRHLRDASQPVHVPRPDRDSGVVVRAVPLDEGAATAAPDGADDRVLVEWLLRALPRHERRIVRLRYFADLSQRGIAGELGLSQVHVSRLLRSSLEHLREALGPGEVSP
jgi:RNA polymerase sigma-B factor